MTNPFRPVRNHVEPETHCARRESLSSKTGQRQVGFMATRKSRLKPFLRRNACHHLVSCRSDVPFFIRLASVRTVTPVVEYLRWSEI